MCNQLNDEVAKRILSKIGQEVHYRFPGDEGRLEGTLKDRAVIVSLTESSVPYWDVVDLIEFNGKKEPWIRFGYYRRPKNRLNWCAQTAPTGPASEWKKIFVNTAREKKWFCKLLKEVCRELGKEGL